MLVARIPVLHGGVFHLGVVLDYNLDDGGMELVLIAHWRGAALQVRHVSVVVGNDERALKLSSVAGVDAEIAAQLHRATHALGDIDERAVAEHATVQRSEEVVTIRYHGAQIFAHQVGMLLDGLADAAEDDALLAQLVLEGGLHRH